MQEEKNEKTLINAAEKEVKMSESREDYKNVNQDAVVFSSEVETVSYTHLTLPTT